MNLDPKDKRTLSETRMAKAKEFLADAGATFDGGRYRTSVNRAYYAALNAVRAILILEGANPETHEGAVTPLSLRFVKTRILPVDIVKKFKILLSRRTDVDYGDFDTIDAKDSEDSLRDAEAIIETIDKVRKRFDQRVRNIETNFHASTFRHIELIELWGYLSLLGLLSLLS